MPLDVQILDDGTGLASVSWLDPKGNVIPAPAGSTVAITSSDDTNVPVGPLNADGLTAPITPAGPLATGVTITATGTLADGTTQFTSAVLVDVVADAGKPSGIALAVTAV